MSESLVKRERVDPAEENGSSTKVLGFLVAIPIHILYGYDKQFNCYNDGRYYIKRSVDLNQVGYRVSFGGFVDFVRASINIVTQRSGKAIEIVQIEPPMLSFDDKRRDVKDAKKLGILIQKAADIIDLEHQRLIECVKIGTLIPLVSCLYYA